MPRTPGVLTECGRVYRETRLALEGVVSGLDFVRKVSCTEGSVPEIVVSLKEQCDAVKGLVDDLKDCLDELAD